MRITSKSGAWSLLGFLLFAVAVVAVAHIPGVREHLSVKSMTDWVEQLGFWGPFGIVAVSLVLPFFFLPRWPVVFVAGALYGIVWGTLLGTVAGTLGAGLHFVLSRRMFHPIGDKVRRRFKLPEKMSDRQAVIVIFTLRAFPLSNYALTNLLAGALGMRLTPFLLATFTGMIPSTLMYAAWGKLLQKPHMGYYALAVLLVLLLMAGTWVAGRKVLATASERSPDDERDPAGG